MLEDEQSPKALDALGEIESGADLPGSRALGHRSRARLAGRGARGRVTQEDVSLALRLLGSLPFTIDLQTTERAFADSIALARQYRLTVYDAAYLKLGLRQGATLATLDGSLRDAALQAGLKVI